MATSVGTITLEPGQVLYHGTRTPGLFDVPDGPAWFSNAYAVAAHFAVSRGRGFSSGRPTVIEYQLTQPIELVEIWSPDDMSRMLADLKSARVATPSRVRIPAPPP